MILCLDVGNEMIVRVLNPEKKKYRKYDRFGPFEEEVTGLTKGRKKR